MVVSDRAYVMLLEESRFTDFTTKPVADARVHRVDPLRLGRQP